MQSEYKGHLLLEACRLSDAPKAKKCLSSAAASAAAGTGSGAASAADLLNFKHPYTGDTALHCAVGSPYPKRKPAVDLLCRKGANLNEKNKEMLTPLHLAADKSHYDIMDLLLKHGAKVNALDLHGQTALHRSARDGELERESKNLKGQKFKDFLSLFRQCPGLSHPPVFRRGPNHRLPPGIHRSAAGGRAGGQASGRGALFPQRG